MRHRDINITCAIAPQIAGSHVYVCGPDAWTDAARTAARAAGVEPGHLHTELFSW